MNEIDYHGARHSDQTGSNPGFPRMPGSRRPWLTAMPLVFLLCAVAPDNAKAQDEAQENLVDRIVAIVGDSVILLNEIVQQEQDMRARVGELPAEGTPQRDSIRRQIVESMVNNQILLQAAARDTLLEVDEARVEDRLDTLMAQMEGSFPNRAELDRVLAEQGLSLQSLREIRREQLRQQQLVGLYVQLNAGQGAVEVTEDEMRAVFETGRATLQQRPATVTFKQVLMRVTPSDSARQTAMDRSEELLERVRAGEDFAELASAYSQDPGSAAAGGDVGWFRRGEMAKAFDEAAFAMPEGAVSDVVETEFGFHIILVERARIAERKARHILIRPVTDYSDVTKARALAEEIAERAQSEDFQALIDLYHDPQTPDSSTVPVREVAQQLPPAYVAALSRREAGEIVGPIEFSFREQDHFAVLKIIQVREAGDYVFEDLKELIRGSLIEEKRREALIERLRAKTYVEIKGF